MKKIRDKKLKSIIIIQIKGTVSASVNVALKAKMMNWEGQKMKLSWLRSDIIPTVAYKYGKIILKCILEKEGGKVLTEPIYMRIGTSGWLLRS